MRVIKQVDFKHERLDYLLTIKILVDGSCALDLSLDVNNKSIPVFEDCTIKGAFIGLVEWLENRDLREAALFCEWVQSELTHRRTSSTGPDLVFSGVELATVENVDDNNTYVLWITTHGNLLAFINNDTNIFKWGHAENVPYAKMQELVITFFGWNTAAKELYTQCGIETTLELK